MNTANSLLEELDLLRLTATRKLDPASRAARGQFLTPLPVAHMMASFFGELPQTVRLLDAGAGVGSLTAAFMGEALSRDPRPRTIRVTAYETDSSLLDYLERTLRSCRDACYGSNVTFEYEIVARDFVAECRNLSGGLFAEKVRSFNCAIMNPPYRKIAADGETRQLLRLINVETGNLYTAFMAVAVEMLEAGGQFVSITPRSFCNGSYFNAFRQFFLGRMALRRIHLFESRKEAFGEDSVLQENMILLAVKSPPTNTVRISSGDAAASGAFVERDVPFAEVVHPLDPERFIRIPTDSLDSEVTEWMHSLDQTADGLGISISTGRVVDFRVKAHLREQPAGDTVPLIYPAHFKHGQVVWPGSNGKKPNAIASNGMTQDLLIPPGVYVFVKRFTAKEEPRRVVAAVCDSRAFFDGPIGVENHVNYIHRKGGGLPRPFAVGLTAFLNSSVFDLYFRQFSGHTQVNATDLRKVKFPSSEKLTELGERIGDSFPDQGVLDNICREVIFTMARSQSHDAVAAGRKVREALHILQQLDMPREQCNERSALTLLALLDLKPETPWSKAALPMRGITEMMDFFRKHYGKRYAPNTRETVRRQTVHQFEQAGLVISNPDDPTRPINSPHWCYQVTEPAHALLRSYGSRAWNKHLKQYRARIESLRSRYAHERNMTRIPVKLSDEHEIYLSAGKHNELVRAIVEEFCPRFAAGARILHVGDTATKWRHLDESAFIRLGVPVELHGKFPDVVALDESRRWIFLIEAVTSHGPVNPKRHEELKSLFKKCRFGLVFVTAFPNRSTLGKYLRDISWETEVWVAESPGHVIHFDGERFLGPYEQYAGKR
jgi:adenine-specific DNA-methyltransferase